MRQTNSSKVAAIHQDLTGPDLVAAINDRLRRLGVPGSAAPQATPSASVSMGTTVGSSSGATYATFVTLTGPTTITSPAAPTDGQIWVVRLDQDATGGRVVTWGSGVMDGPEIDATVNSEPSTTCRMTFVGWGGKWYCGGDSILGRKIV